MNAVMKKEATAFAPASVGNIGVGFDIIGHSIAGAGDRVTVRRIDEPRVVIESISGVVRNLPRDAELNTAGAALIAFREALDLGSGFMVSLEKGIAFGSGMGGSAASAVAALVAANELLDEPLSREELYPYALTGESAASGGRHGDNVGPQLVGGLVLATAHRLVRLNVPEAWHCLLVHPHAVIETRSARAVLQHPYGIAEVVTQTANLSLVLTGCERGDAEMVRDGLNDVLVEPRRAHLIPGFAEVKHTALLQGALGASISGAGPSVFAWFESRERALAAAPPLQEAFTAHGVSSEYFVSPINGPRAEVLA